MPTVHAPIRPHKTLPPAGNAREKAVGIRDVADAAGVSLATVSNILNGKSRSPVREETRRAVVEAAARLNYQPSRAARTLRTQRHHQIGLVTLLESDVYGAHFMHEVIKGAVEGAKSKDCMLSILGYHDHAEELEVLREAVANRTLDGVILLGVENDDPRLPIIKGQMPFVMLGNCPDENVWTVDSDNIGAGLMATQHLLQAGHERIAFLNRPLRYTVSQDRFQGYKNALEEAGIAYSPELVVEADSFDTEAGYRAALKLLDETSPLPTAIVAMDDSAALKAIQAAQQRGLRVPQDLAVVGINDDGFAALSTPALTTVRVFVQKLAFYAADMLIRLSQDEPVLPRHYLLPTQLIIRQSCGAEIGASPSRS